MCEPDNASSEKSRMRKWAGLSCSAISRPPISRCPALRSSARKRGSTSGAHSIFILESLQERGHELDGLLSPRRSRHRPRALWDKVDRPGVERLREEPCRAEAD